MDGVAHLHTNRKLNKIWDIDGCSDFLCDGTVFGFSDVEKKLIAEFSQNGFLFSKERYNLSIILNA